VFQRLDENYRSCGCVLLNIFRKHTGGVPASVAIHQARQDLDFFSLKDGWSLSAGTGVTLGDLFASASYDWSKAATGGPDSQELFFLAAGPITREGAGTSSQAEA
jgi:hypothetical protein